MHWFRVHNDKDNIIKIYRNSILNSNKLSNSLRSNSKKLFIVQLAFNLEVSWIFSPYIIADSV